MAPCTLYRLHYAGHMHILTEALIPSLELGQGKELLQYLADGTETDGRNFYKEISHDGQRVLVRVDSQTCPRIVAQYADNTWDVYTTLTSGEFEEYFYPKRNPFRQFNPFTRQ